MFAQVAYYREAAMGFGGHWWWKYAETRRAPADREVRAVLVGLETLQGRTFCALHRPFTPYTDCSAVGWLAPATTRRPPRQCTGKRSA